LGKKKLAQKGVSCRHFTMVKSKEKGGYLASTQKDKDTQMVGRRWGKMFLAGLLKRRRTMGRLEWKKKTFCFS